MAEEKTHPLEKHDILGMAPPSLRKLFFTTPGGPGGQILPSRKEPTSIDGSERGGSERSQEDVPSPSMVQFSPEVPENAELPQNLKRRASPDKSENAKSPRNLRSRSLSEKPESTSSKSSLKKKKFSITLSPEQIEEDLLLITGKKPLRQPKKCPKPVQKNLDHLFPGIRFQEETPNL